MKGSAVYGDGNESKFETYGASIKGEEEKENYIQKLECENRQLKLGLQLCSQYHGDASNVLNLEKKNGALEHMNEKLKLEVEEIRRRAKSKDQELQRLKRQFGIAGTSETTHKEILNGKQVESSVDRFCTPTMNHKSNFNAGAHFQEICQLRDQLNERDGELAMLREKYAECGKTCNTLREDNSALRNDLEQLRLSTEHFSKEQNSLLLETRRKLENVALKLEQSEKELTTRELEWKSKEEGYESRIKALVLEQSQNDREWQHKGEEMECMKGELQQLKQKYEKDASEAFNARKKAAGIIRELMREKKLAQSAVDEMFEIGDKDAVIKNLTEELQKRTNNLQELVNKELWDKNREIEKLYKLCGRRKQENEHLRRINAQMAAGIPKSGKVLASRDPNMDVAAIYAKENVNCTSDDVKLLREQLGCLLEEKKCLLDKIHCLETQIENELKRSANVSLIRNLRLECAKRGDDLEVAEQSRKEAVNACVLLTTRLEELATFLESMIGGHDDHHCGIGSKKRELIRQAIDRSREIAKSFADSRFSCADVSAPILPDCSEINLSFSGGEESEEFDRVRGLETSTECIPEGRVTFAHLNCSSELIFIDAGEEALKATASSALVSMDDMKVCSLDSESETWSEPDRNVSAARIGLTDLGVVHVRRARVDNNKLETDSDENAPRNETAGNVHSRYLPSSRQEEPLEKKSESSDERRLCLWLKKVDNENCADENKYRNYVLVIKRHLQDAMKYLRKTNRGNCDEFLTMKLQEVSRYFDQSQECFMKLREHLNDFKSRCVTLTEVLEETQTKFEHVMRDLQMTKTAYETLIQDYERQVKEWTLNEAEFGESRAKFKSDVEFWERENAAMREEAAQRERNLSEISDKCSDMSHQLDEVRASLDGERVQNSKLAKEVTILEEKVSLLESREQDLLHAVREKENETLEVNCCLLQLKNEMEFERGNATKRLEEEGVERKRFEMECGELRDKVLDLSSKEALLEKEKARLMEELRTVREEYESCQVGHDEKMKKVLEQIMEYRDLEENSSEAHRRLMAKVEEVNVKGTHWKDAMECAREWKAKWETAVEEKELAERALEEVRRVERNIGSQMVMMETTRSENARLKQLEKDYKTMKSEAETNFMNREAELRHKLEISTLTISYVIYEWVKVANEKLHLHQQLRDKCLQYRDKPQYVRHLENVKCELEHRVMELETANKNLELRLWRLTASKMAFPSDSEESSDKGSRYSGGKWSAFSSLPCSPPRWTSNSAPSSPTKERKSTLPFLKTTSLSHPTDTKNEDCWRFSAPPLMSPDLGIDSDGNHGSFDSTNYTRVQSKLINLEHENRDLKGKLYEMRKELDKITEKLNVVNGDKKKMEKAIFKQIYETKHILKKARINLEDVKSMESNEV